MLPRPHRQHLAAYLLIPPPKIQHRHTFERSCSQQIGLRRIRIRRLDLRAEGSHEREIVAGELYRNSNSPPAVFGMSLHTEPYVLGPTKCGEIKTKYGVSTRLF